MIVFQNPKVGKDDFVTRGPADIVATRYARGGHGLVIASKSLWQEPIPCPAFLLKES
jgi:hypothetical protein